MQVAGLEKLISGTVMLVIGLGITIKNKNIAKVCRNNKVKMLGKAQHDDIGELIARFAIITIGIVAVLGSFLKIYEYLK